jgi:putative molybdopterin biosynthesis protein
MVALVETQDGFVAYPTAKGSGSVTSFAQADGFLTIDALADHLPAGAGAEVTLLAPHVKAPDLAIVGSHCVGLDAVVGRLAEQGFSARLMAVGSLGGLAAARRGECDLAPIHLLDPKTDTYNADYLTEGLDLVPGWRRMQGLVFRAGDPRFEGRAPDEAVRLALQSPDCLMVNRNQGAGTRILIERLLGGARPEGYWNQPKSHNAVAAAVAQGRADWGLAIAPVARDYGLGFTALTEEHYDFALVSAHRSKPAVAAFLALLDDPQVLQVLRDLGFRRAGEVA